MKTITVFEIAVGSDREFTEVEREEIWSYLKGKLNGFKEDLPKVLIKDATSMDLGKGVVYYEPKE
jgi:hypothetical protein